MQSLFVKPRDLLLPPPPPHHQSPMSSAAALKKPPFDEEDEEEPTPTTMSTSAAGASPPLQADLRRELCSQNLFVFHLPSEWREDDLTHVFSRFGNILSVKVVKRPDMTSKGYGFVCFETPESAAAAMDAMNGFAVNGKRLKVSIKKTPEECLKMQVQKLIKMSETCEDFDRDRDCSLFVFHLPPHWDDNDLKAKFASYGPVVAAKVSRKEDGTSRGYGFVTCADPKAAALAIMNLNGSEVCNKRLKVQPKQMSSGSHPRPDCTIFVFHLPNDWTDSNLKEYFASCGRVVSATVQRDPKGRSRGFGFVTFDRPQWAREAVGEHNGAVVGNKRLKVSLKKVPQSSSSEEHLLLSTTPISHQPPQSTAATTTASNQALNYYYSQPPMMFGSAYGGGGPPPQWPAAPNRGRSSAANGTRPEDIVHGIMAAAASSSLVGAYGTESNKVADLSGGNADHHHAYRVQPPPDHSQQLQQAVAAFAFQHQQQQRALWGQTMAAPYAATHPSLTSVAASSSQQQQAHQTYGGSAGFATNNSNAFNNNPLLPNPIMKREGAAI